MSARVCNSEERCPVCGAASPPLAFVKKGYPLHRCVLCEVVYSARPPEGRDIEDLYSASYFTGGGAGYPDYLADERTHRRQARQYLRRIDTLGLSPGAVLDVGCAAGFFLDEARRAGWRAEGCEISEYAQEHATRRLGLDVKRAGFLDAQFSASRESFDVVTMFNVLEHIPDPVAVADRAFTLLRPGGYLVIETWDPRSWFARLLGSWWPTYAPPTVLYCYTRRTLSRVFDRDKWSFVSYRPATKWISLDHGLSLLEYEANRTPLSPLLRGLRRSFVSRIDVPYCLGDLALGIFRRPPALALSTALAADERLAADDREDDRVVHGAAQ
ncbi:MAG TPA: class I SAM-dependent methyltransferase [Polyangiaceae bacterium]|nr:class I SAM-dependent methyltransferase [Polyangiaceae bacterium]